MELPSNERGKEGHDIAVYSYKIVRVNSDTAENENNVEGEHRRHGSVNGCVTQPKGSQGKVSLRCSL